MIERISLSAPPLVAVTPSPRTLHAEMLRLCARIGYSHNGGQWEVALFGRNITDEENVKGGIDFNNLTAFDNEPRVVGVTVTARFR